MLDSAREILHPVSWSVSFDPITARPMRGTYAPKTCETQSQTHQWSVPTSGMHRNCTTYNNTHTGTYALIATSQQYPNSNSSFPSPSPAAPRSYRPLLRPGIILLFGPSKYFMRKKFRVLMSREERRKWTKMKTRVIFRIEGTERA